LFVFLPGSGAKVNKAAQYLIACACLVGLAPIDRGEADNGANAPGGVRYEAKLHLACGAQKTCSIVFAAVPDGHRLAVERIAVAAEIVGGSFLRADVVARPSGGLLSSARFSVAGQDALILRERAVRPHVDAGGAYTAILATDGFFSPINPTAFVMVSGHPVDCSADPCGPKADPMTVSHRASERPR
jgi:hypothetical protein